MIDSLFILAILGVVVGGALWLFLYIVEPNTIAIPVLFGEREDKILEEGAQLYKPLRELISHSVQPRERKNYGPLTVNTLYGAAVLTGTIGFELFRSQEMKQKMRECGIENVSQEKNYLLLFDKREKQLETDALARLKEMLDEQLSKVPLMLAITKEYNDAVILAVLKGLKYKSSPNDKTAEKKIIDLIKKYRDTVYKEMTEKGAVPKEIPDIPIPSKQDLPPEDVHIRGLEQMFIEDYGVVLTILTLKIEPNQRTGEARDERLIREIKRDVKRQDTEFVNAQIRILTDNGSDRKDAEKIVMAINDYYEKPQIHDYNIHVSGVSSKVVAAATALLGSAGMLKPKKGKKKGGKS